MAEEATYVGERRAARGQNDSDCESEQCVFVVFPVRVCACECVCVVYWAGYRFRIIYTNANTIKAD